MIENLKEVYPDISISVFLPPNLPYDELCKEEYVMDLMQKHPDIVWVFRFPNKKNLYPKLSKSIK